MKRQSSLVVSLACAAALLPLTALAASDTSTDTKVEAGTSQEQRKSNVRPHSHLEEKTGIVTKKADEKKADEPTSDEPASDKPKAKKPTPYTDKSKHFHPRDGK